MLTEPGSLKAASRRVRIARLVAFVVLWTLMTLSAQAVARPAMLWLRAPWGGLIAGLLTGTLQWSALGAAPRMGAPGRAARNSVAIEDALPGSDWWVAATGIALGLASFLQGRIAPEPAAILTGALVGIAQWLVLRQSVRWSAHWILVSTALAWPAASLALMAVAWLTPRNSLLISQVLAGALQGTLVGTATGLLLATLLPGARGGLDEEHAPEVL